MSTNLHPNGYGEEPEDQQALEERVEKFYELILENLLTRHHVSIPAETNLRDIMQFNLSMNERKGMWFIILQIHLEYLSDTEKHPLGKVETEGAKSLDVDSDYLDAALRSLPSSNLQDIIDIFLIPSAHKFMERMEDEATRERMEKALEELVEYLTGIKNQSTADIVPIEWGNDVRLSWIPQPPPNEIAYRACQFFMAEVRRLLRSFIPLEEQEWVNDIEPASTSIRLDQMDDDRVQLSLITGEIGRKKYPGVAEKITKCSYTISPEVAAMAVNAMAGNQVLNAYREIFADMLIALALPEKSAEISRRPRLEGDKKKEDSQPILFQSNVPDPDMDQLLNFYVSVKKGDLQMPKKKKKSSKDQKKA